MNGIDPHVASLLRMTDCEDLFKSKKEQYYYLEAPKLPI